MLNTSLVLAQNHFLFFITSLILLNITSCSPSSATKEKVDTIVHNAQVYTVDSRFSVQESFAIKDGRFVAVGKGSDILEKYTADTIFDMQGKAVYPGFIDAHCHFYYYGDMLKYARLNGAKSFDEVLERLKEQNKNNESQWLLGRGWDQNDWDDKRFPDKTRLDRLFPDKAVVLTRVDGHAVLANSRALHIAGITADSKFDGGEVVVKNGEPTGILIDNAADLMRDFIPQPSNNEMKVSLMQAQENCFEVGLTSVHDAGLPKHILQLIDSLQQQGQLKMRIYAMLEASEENFEYYMQKGIYKTPYLNIRSVKLYADGALGSRGAKLLEPYSDAPENTGLLVNTPEYLEKISRRAYENGYQTCIHAIGDSANRLVISIYSRILEENNQHRWRIEHAQMVQPTDYALLKKYNIIPSVQTTHATSDMLWAIDRIGGERLRYAYAYHDLLEVNGWLPNGSDFPIEDINPLYGFYAGVVRKNLDAVPDGGFQMENALSRKQMLQAMTLWAAYAAFEENEKGSIEAGKYADFVVLEKDIMQIAEEEIPHVKVLQTFSGGQPVFSHQ